LKPIDNLKTKSYFNDLTPHFSPNRYNFALDYINQHADNTTKLIDIGCGDGSTLLLIKENSRICNLTGMDISEQYLNKAKMNVQCNTIQASILDNDIIQQYRDHYDFCILGAVLHHIIKKTRKSSYRAVHRAIKNSLELLKNDGYLIIFEPTLRPKFLMDVIFYIKKFFSLFTSNRIELGFRWLNIGLPIVSYYTKSQIYDTLKTLDVFIVENKIIDKYRVGLFIQREGIGLILQKKLGYIYD
jgi:SAM-dependent methyltransferase